jgi:hypothetical protein
MVGNKDLRKTPESITNTDADIITRLTSILEPFKHATQLVSLIFNGISLTPFI